MMRLPLLSYAVTAIGALVGTATVNTCVFGVLPGSGLCTVTATLLTTPLSVNASGDAPGDGLRLTVTGPETTAESGPWLAFGDGCANAATTKRSVPIGAVTVNVHVSPPPLAAAHGLGVATGNICKPGGDVEDGPNDGTTEG